MFIPKDVLTAVREAEIERKRQENARPIGGEKNDNNQKANENKKSTLRKEKNSEYFYLTSLSSFPIGRIENPVQKVKLIHELDKGITSISDSDEFNDINKYENEVNIVAGKKETAYGMQTDMAPIKTVLKQHSIQNLIIIASDSVIGNCGSEYGIKKGAEPSRITLDMISLPDELNQFPDKNHFSTLDYFLKEIKYFITHVISEKKNNIENIFIYNVSDLPDRKVMSDYAVNIAEKIYQSPDPFLEIESNGGPREFMTIILAVLRALRIHDISPKAVYYSEFSRGSSVGHTENRPIQIRDKKDRYEIFDVVSGIDEFRSFGRVKRLIDYYTAEGDGNVKDEGGQIIPVLKAVQRLCDAFSLCIPDNMLKSLESVSSAIGHFQKEAASNLENYIYSEIRTDFGEELLSDKQTQDDKILSLIQWCVKKEYIQQAVTLYIERLPFYYFSKHILNSEETLYQADDLGLKEEKTLPENFYLSFFMKLNGEQDLIIAFRHSLENAIKKYDESNDIQKALDELAKFNVSDIPNDTCVENLQGLIRNHFDNAGINTNISLNSFEKGLIGRNGISGKNLSKFLNEMRSDASCRNILGLPQKYSCPPEIKNIENDTERHQGDTYLEKKRQIDRMDVYPRELDSMWGETVYAGKRIPVNLKRIAEYYLAFKLIRNNINHASGKLLWQEKELVHWLVSDNISGDGLLNGNGHLSEGEENLFIQYDNVKDILYEAIAFHEDLIACQQ